jgi:diaminopimelate decarboxylase
MRPALYDAYHEIVEVSPSDEAPSTYEIVGPVCESGDFLGRARNLRVKDGELLAILSAGAYGMSMSSNYNTRPRAAEVMVDGVQVHLIRTREKVEELFALEKILP